MTDAQDTATLPLPTPGAGEAFRHLPVLAIAPSPTNPRKYFDPAKLQELADSIAASGVHQPILVRPLTAERLPDEMARAKAENRPVAEYELICGERRWRATQRAGVGSIPAMIRQMDDVQVLETQIVENLQRQDVTELEEAEGYRALMQAQGIKAEELGAKVKKSRAYIYARLKILDLCEAGRDALRQGKLDFSQALPIARIANAKLQASALQDMKSWDYEMSAREVKRWVQIHYMAKLEYAVFDTQDAILLPQAGACTACPHRTGADPAQLEDGDADVCTNPVCFKAKEDAHAQRERQRAQDMGCEIIEGKAARALVSSAYSSEVKGYLRLDSASDSPVKGKTLRKLVGKAMQAADIKPTMVVNPHDPKQIIAVLRPEQATQLLEMAGNTQAQAQVEKEAQANAAAQAEEAQRRATDHYERTWRSTVMQHIAQRLQNDPSPQMLALATQAAAQFVLRHISTDTATALCKYLGLGKESPVKTLREHAKQNGFPIALAGLVDAQMDADYSPTYWKYSPEVRPNARMLDMAQACGVDVEAIKAQVQADLAPAAPPSSAAQKPDLPLAPAAPPAQGAGKGKAKTSTGGTKGKPQRGPAARAGGGGGKLTAQAATAGIAAALQALPGEPEPGADAQSNDAGAVAAGASQPPGPLVTLKRKKTIVPPADTPAVALEGDTGKPTANAAADEWPPALGTRVRIVKATPGSKQELWVGQEGKVSRHAQNKRIDVTFYKDGSAVPVILLFYQQQVEVMG